MKPNVLAMDEYSLSCLSCEILKYKYSIAELERIVKYSGVSLKAIVRTQKLTKNFIRDFILSEKYTILDSDTNLDVNYISQFQEHYIFL